MHLTNQINYASHGLTVGLEKTAVVSVRKTEIAAE